MSNKKLTILLFLICVVCAAGLSACGQRNEEPVVVVPTRPSGDSPQLSSRTPESELIQTESHEQTGLAASPTPETDSGDQSASSETEEETPADRVRQGSASTLLYQVNFVADDDFLNIRRNPGVESRIVSKIPPGTHGITINGEGRWLGTSLWVPVKAEEFSGWVNSRYLVEEVDQAVFCADKEVKTLIQKLYNAVQSRDDDAFADLVEPGRGLRIRRHWWNPEVLLDTEALTDIFNGRESYKWGIADGSGDEMDGTFKEIILPLLEENLLSATETGCGEILHGGTAGIVQLPAPYTGINYYSFYRPPSPDQIEFDWGTWVIGVERWQDEYRLSFLIHFEWEI